MAPEGQALVVVDLSQIECRMVNWLAGQQDVLEAFRSGRDIYCESASRFYGRAITKNDKKERQIFKSVELGCGYGMGAKKFREYARQAGNIVTETQAEELIKFYRHTHEMVCRYWRDAEKHLHELSLKIHATWGPMTLANGHIVYPNGGYQVFKDLQKGENNEWHYTVRGRDQKIYGGLLTENVTQALSRVLLSQAMLKIANQYKIVLCCHDEVVFLAPESKAEDAYKFGIETLTTNPDWCKDLPLAAEGGWDKRYSK